MRANILLLALLVLGSLALSVLLLPGRDERAAMALRTGDTEDAKALLETALARGEVTPAVVGPLADIALAEGEPERAATLMEQLLARHPGSLEVLDRLSALYRAARDYGALRHVLEELAALDPTEPRLRELLELYGFRGLVAERLPVLQRLAALGVAQADERVELSERLAVGGDKPGALAALAPLTGPTCTEVDAATLAAALAVELRDGPALEGLVPCLQHLGPAEYAGVADQVAERGWRDEALSLLVRAAGSGNDDPRVLRSLVQMEMAAGRGEWALGRLRDRARRVALEPDLRVLYVDLLLNAGRFDEALTAAGNDLDFHPDWQLRRLAEAAEQAGGTPRVWELRDAIPVERLGDNPLLALRLALGAGDKAGADALFADPRTRQAGLAVPGDYAALLWRGGRLEEAATQALARLEQPGEVPADALALAGLAVEGFLAAGKPDRAEQVANRLAARYPDAVGASLRARIALTRGRPAEALALLAGAAETPDTLALKLDALVALDRDAEVATLVAGRLPAAEAGERRRLANSLGAVALRRPELVPAAAKALVPDLSAWLSAPALAGEPRGGWAVLLARLEPANGLPWLARLANAEPQAYGETYLSLLKADGRGAEATRYLAARLSVPRLPVDQRDRWLSLLLDTAGPEAALPYLAQAVERPGAVDWTPVHEEALAGAGKSDLLRQALLKRAAKPGQEPDTLRGISFRLLELGDKSAAEALFKRVATTEPPDGPAVSQLRYLWGPRPGPAGMAWLRERAAKAKGAEKAAWLRHLADAGDDGAVLALAQGERDAVVLDQALDAALRRGDGEALEALAPKLLAANAGPESLRRLGQAAEGLGRDALASKAYAALLTRKPDDRDGLAGRGRLAWRSGDYGAVRRDMGAVVATGPSDAENHYLYAETLRMAGRDADALPHYRAAITQADRTPGQGQIVRAQALHRVGRTGEALDAFAALLRREPGNKALRADYAGLLMELGRLGEARVLLEGAP